MSAIEIEDGNAAGYVFWLRFWKRVIAALEVLGGLYGLFGVVFGNMWGSNRIILLIAFVLFVGAIWGGILLALDRRAGVAISLVVQAFQLVQICTVSVLYSFVCGFQLIIGLRQAESVPDIGLGFSYPARFFCFLNPPPQAVLPDAFSGLNCVAILAIICLLCVRAFEKKASLPRTQIKIMP